ncbi:MAG: signal peptidase I [Alphaproteobacteria bacterium]
MENLNPVDQEEIPKERQAKIEKLNKQLEKQSQKEKSGWFGLMMAVLAALAIRSLAFEPYHIPSSSMVPTLLIGDYLFITKFDYGYSRHSFPFSLPLIPTGRVFYVQPERGDVVIFKKPPENKIDYIKRVIGVPGDTIQLRNGRLYINGQLVPRKDQGQEYWDTEAGRQLYTRYTETLPNGVVHDIYELTDNNIYDETDPVFIPENHFFMMGDNRDNSLDSRYFGLVPAENLEGKARLIFYSTNGDGWFFQFWRWSQFLRLERFFTDIK